jgi:hypothetical protein
MRYIIVAIAGLAVAGLPALEPDGQETAGQLQARPAIAGHLSVATQRWVMAPIPVQTEGRSSETIANLPFDKCGELMREKIAALNADPMGVISVVNTRFMKIIRVCTDPGDVVFTCSEADQRLVVTTSQTSADKRCQ